MPEPKPITITVNHRRVTLDTRSVQYVFVDHNTAEFHLSNDARYRTRIPIKTLEPMLGDEFIRIYLNNGESLAFPAAEKEADGRAATAQARGAPRRSRDTGITGR